MLGVLSLWIIERLFRAGTNMICEITLSLVSMVMKLDFAQLLGITGELVSLINFDYLVANVVLLFSFRYMRLIRWPLSSSDFAL